MAQNAFRFGHRQDVSLAKLYEVFPSDVAAQLGLEKQRSGGQPYCPLYASFDVRHDTAQMNVNDQAWQFQDFAGFHSLGDSGVLTQISNVVLQDLEMTCLTYSALKQVDDLPLGAPT